MPLKDWERDRKTRPGLISPRPYLLLISVLFFLLPAAGPEPSHAQPGGNATAGKMTYAKWCSSCHGKNGEGVGNMPSFRDRKYMEMRTDLDLFQKITKGGQGTGMPPFATLLAEQDRWNVIAYIRTLSPSR